MAGERWDDEAQIAQRSSVSVKQISIQGFKSFRLKANVGPLSHFSCIVGPNGAGKSVIGEALAFVLGGSAKTLRAKCLSALLNEDLRTSGAKLYGKVSVTLEGPHSRLVKVSRVITGSTSSYIWSSNGTKRQVSFADLRQELLQFGIATDISERFIITQSRQAIKAKQPLDLYEHLEVIFGAGHLKGMIMEAEREICDKSNEIILLQEKLSDLQSKIEKLRPEVEKWQSFDNQWHDFQCRKVSYLRSQEDVVKCKLQQNSAEWDKKLNAYHSVQESKYSVQDLQRKATMEICTSRTLLQQKKRDIEALDKRTLDLRRRMVKAQVRVDVARRDAENKRQEQFKMHQEQNELREQVTALSFRLNSLRDQRQALGQQREVLIEKKPHTSEQENGSKIKAQDCSNAASEDVEGIVEKILTSQEALAILKSELEAHEVEAANLSKEVHLMESQYMETTKARQKRELHELALQKSLHATLQELEKLSSCIPPLKETFKKNEFEMYTLKKKILSFEKSARKTSREDSAVEFLRATLDGRFIGRVIDLAMVKGRMTVAVNSVMAHLINASKTFVTKDRKTANEVILYFQEHKIGVVTCEILSELSRLNPNVHNPPNHGQGKPVMDYIHCEDMYKPVFCKYLKNWVILEDRDAALAFLHERKSVIYCQKNIVTFKGDIFKLDGEVISATIHASGKCLLQPCDDHGQTGRCNKLSTSEFEKYKEEVLYLSERQLVLKEEIMSIENKCTALQTQVRELQTQLQNLQEGKQIDNMNQLSFRLAEKRKAFSNLRCEIENLEIGVSEIRNCIFQLQEQRDRIMSPEMAAWRSKFEALCAEISSCDLEIQKKSSFMKSILSKLNGLEILASEVISKESQLAEAERHYAQAKEELDKESSQKDKLASEVEILCQSLAAASKLANKYNGKIGTLQKKESELKTQIEKLSVCDLDLRDRMDKVLKALPECSQDLPSKRVLHDFTNSINANHMGKDEEDMEGVALAEEELSLKDLHRTINPCTLDEDLCFRKEELQTLEKLEHLEKVLESIKLRKETLENERYSIFMSSVIDVNSSLSQVYGSFTKHGDAYLSFTEEKTLLFTEGVNFQVRPGRHKWCSFNILSGGQQALAALALSFSLQHRFPSPFYFFDEIDAALDAKNTQLVANYVKKQTSTQYIIVSHRPQLYEEASTLAGIYHFCGSSRTVTAQT